MWVWWRNHREIINDVNMIFNILNMTIIKFKFGVVNNFKDIKKTHIIIVYKYTNTNESTGF